MGFGKDRKGAIVSDFVSVTVGTLASRTGKLIPHSVVNTAPFRILRHEVIGGIKGSAVADEGSALALGLTRADLTLSEIEETLDLIGPTGPGKIIETERSERRIWWCGMVDPVQDAAATDYRPLRDMITGGPMMVVTPRWTFDEGLGWQHFMYNFGDAVATTGKTMRIAHRSFGLWL